MKIYEEMIGVPFDSDSIQEAVATFIIAQAIESRHLDYDTVRDTLYDNEWDCPLSMGGKVAFVPGGQNAKSNEHDNSITGGEYKRVYPRIIYR